MKRLALLAAFCLATTAAVAGATSSERAPRFDRLDGNADGKLSRAEASLIQSWRRNSSNSMPTGTAF